MSRLIDIEVPPTEEDWINKALPLRSKKASLSIEVGIESPSIIIQDGFGSTELPEVVIDHKRVTKRGRQNNTFNVRPFIPRGMRREVLLASNGMCCICRKKNGTMQLHHIGEDRFNTKHSGLVVLCVKHHDRVHLRGSDTGKAISRSMLRVYKRNWETEVKRLRAIVIDKNIVENEKKKVKNAEIVVDFDKDLVIIE